MDGGPAVACGLVGVGLILVGCECYRESRSHQRAEAARRDSIQQNLSWQQTGQQGGVNSTVSRKFSRVRLEYSRSQQTASQSSVEGEQCCQSSSTRSVQDGPGQVDREHVTMSSREKKTRWFSRLRGRVGGKAEEPIRCSDTQHENLRAESCPICLETMGEELDEAHVVDLLLLPCGHAFHEACIDHWIRDSVVCPVCKQRLDIDLSPKHAPRFLLDRLRSRGRQTVGGEGQRPVLVESTPPVEEDIETGSGRPTYHRFNSL